MAFTKKPKGEKDPQVFATVTKPLKKRMIAAAKADHDRPLSAWIKIQCEKGVEEHEAQAGK